MSAVERARRNRRIEAVALGMLAILPLVPHFTFLLRVGVPRFGLIGELALVEHATRHVWTGETLVGAPSRFGWSQPGPLFFYFAAPFQAMFGSASTGLYLAAGLVNGVAAAVTVASARLFARRAHAIATLFVVLAWFSAFGALAASPFPPFLIVMPLMAFLFNAAMLARGKSAAVFPAVLFGTLAAQTHVAALPIVMAGTIGSVAAFLIGARSRPQTPELSGERWRMGIASGIALILCVPPIVEQIIAPTGNFRAIVGFFVHRPAPLQSLGFSTQEWMTVMSWLPYRLVNATILHEDFVPWMASPNEIYLGTTGFPAIVASIHVGLGVTSAMIAAKRRDVGSIALLAVGAAANVLAILSIQSIVGVSATYLVFWTSAASCIFWMGVLSTLFSAIGAGVLKVPQLAGAAATPMIITGLTLAVVTASLQRFGLAKHPAAVGSHPELRPEIAAVYAPLADRLGHYGTTPVVHLEGATDIALGIFLELEKDRIDVRIPAADRTRLPYVRTDERLAKPFHVWLASASSPHRLAKCTEVVAKSGDLVVLGSNTPVISCQ